MTEEGQNNTPKEEEPKLESDNFTTEDRAKQKAEIEAEINKRPLVGWLERGVDSLLEEFKANPSFLRKLPALGTKYPGLRRVRGDGNCFYRSFSYLLVELMLTDKTLFNAVKTKVDTSMKYLENVGYTEAAVGFFVEEAMAFFAESFPKNEPELDAFFGDPNGSMYIIWFMRLLAAGYIKHHWAERFVFFAGEGYLDGNDYCAKEIEPADRECEQIAVISLCEFFEIRTCVEYLDQNPGEDETTTYFFGPGNEGDEARIHILYRPGHYDILYKTLS